MMDVKSGKGCVDCWLSIAADGVQTKLMVGLYFDESQPQYHNDHRLILEAARPW